MGILENGKSLASPFFTDPDDGAAEAAVGYWGDEEDRVVSLLFKYPSWNMASGAAR
ncbi:hypothetical protein [Paracoccus aminovorans]|uniref:hypothetical protein n=1 Tax=Paracoccus aminovorans TaxID=34004 RepID=UPI00147F0752|nr:hypothetical protein [Paracoccus aminovorans]